MPQCSILEAARMAKVSRSDFYKIYIEQGRVSVLKDPYGAPCIDVSELIRVLPDTRSSEPKKCAYPPADSYASKPVEQNENNDNKVKSLQAQVDGLQKQVEDLTDVVKRLETNKPEQSKSWWKFWG